MAIQDSPEPTGGAQSIAPPPKRRHWHMPPRRLFWSAFLPLIMVSSILANWAFLAQNVFAAPAASASTPGQNTFQQFLAQGQKSKAPHGAFVYPADKPSNGKTPAAKVGQANQLPSAEPPTMKPLSLALTSTQTVAPLAKTASVKPTDLKGSDGRLEVLVPAGAFDLSQATTAQGKAASGPFTFKVTHLHGNAVGEMNMLGSYQFQVLDGSGQPVQGVVLRQPITLVYHYKVKELQSLQLDPDHLIVSWPLAPGASGQTQSQTTSASGQPTSQAFPMTNDSKQHTLTAQISGALASPATSSVGTSFGDDQSPPKPNFISEQGSSGNIGYSYPIQMAPGPAGLTPPLQFSYSSAIPNDQHNSVQPAGDEGEGWSIGLGSISGGAAGYSISGIDGVSDQLVPIPNQSGFYETEHISHLRIQLSGSCFKVWDTAGNYYELGCTSDSLQYYTNILGRTNYRWDEDREALANEGPGTPEKEVLAHYLQDTATVSGYTSVRDASASQVQYGTLSSDGKTFTAAGTVDFLYRAPSNSSTKNGLGEQWSTAYGTNYNCGVAPPVNTSLRCDDPVADGSVQPPAVMSTMMLQKVETFVGDDSSTSHLDYSYALAYQVDHNVPFRTCYDSYYIGVPMYCAGSMVLASLTPTAYLQGTGHALKPVVFTNTAPLGNSYFDSSETVYQSSTHYGGQTWWQYLNGSYDANTGVGEKITYATAWNNTHGTPIDSNGDDRHDPLYCTTHTDCTGTYANPNDHAWSVQVVTQIQNWSADSSSSALSPATTTYKYQLQVTGTGCPAAGSDTDCVGDTWLPSGDNNWLDYYDGQFQGFATVMTTSPAGNLTVQHYASNAGWGSATTNPLNYLSGNLLDEEVYSGNSVAGPLLEQTTNTYAGESGTSTPNACDTSVTGTYIPCETVLLSTQKTMYEGSNASTALSTSGAVSSLDNYTYDDYNPSASGSGLETGTGHYHNLTQDQVETLRQGESCGISCGPPPFNFNLALTKKWQYATNDQTVNSWTYYDVDKVSESEIDDPSGHIWNCQTTTYDEGVASGVPTPAEGLATTVNTYSSANCASKTSPLTTLYTGYDSYGNVVVTVDPLAAANSSLYTGHGCKAYPVPGSSPPMSALITPNIFTTAWQGSYTTCTVYDETADAQPIWQSNALDQMSRTGYDTAQQDLPVSMIDANGQTTTAMYSYDTNGNSTIQIKQPLETGSYTSQTSTLSTCAATLPSSAPLPCYQEDGNTSLYSGAVSRTFYDAQGRAVETRTPGPIAGDDTVVITVYNDQNNTVWKSVPFLVADGSGYLDPNGIKDINGHAPAGTTTFMDALGRAIAVQDPNWNSTQEPGLTCSTVLTGKYTSCVNYNSGGTNDTATSIDANGHVTTTETNGLGLTVLTVKDGGVYGGTLTAQQETSIQYTVLNKPTKVTVTDAVSQNGASVTTSMTYDDLGQLLTEDDPDQGNFSFTYDPDGHVLSETQTSGSSSRTLGFNYDILGRLGCEQTAAPTSINATGACTAGNPLIQNTYDVAEDGWTNDYPIGRLSRSNAYTYYPDGTSALIGEDTRYDQRGRVVESAMGLQLPSSWNVTTALPTSDVLQIYNDANQVTTTSTLAGSAGYTFTNVYDSTTGTQIGLSNNGNSTANLATLTYNEYGQLGTLTYLNGALSSPAQIASETFNYDGDLRPTSLSASWLPPSNNSGTILSSGRTYDNASNVTSSSTTFAAVPGQSGSGGSEVQNFCYNEQNELVWAGNNGTQPGKGSGTCGSGTLTNGLSSAGYNNAYTYTNLGQIWQAPIDGSTNAKPYLYCDSAHPHQVSGIYDEGTCSDKQGTVIYTATYDPWGNVNGYTLWNSWKVATLSYDPLNRLVNWSGTTNGVAASEQYVYDASGQRVLKRSTNAGSTTLAMYPNNGEEYDYSNTGTLTSQLHYYSLAGHLIGSFDGTNTTYYLTDAEGSVLTSFSQSAVQGEQIYDPYGYSRYQAGTINTAKGYTGQTKDSVTGLDYYNARYYLPDIDMFLSPDNVQGNAQGADPYSYVGGNPETRTDPTGQKAIGCPPNSQDCSPTGTPTGGGSTGGGNNPPTTCQGSVGKDGASAMSCTTENQCPSGMSPSGKSCVYDRGNCKGLTVQGCTGKRNNQINGLKDGQAGWKAAGSFAGAVLSAWQLWQDLTSPDLKTFWKILLVLGDAISVLGSLSSAFMQLNKIWHWGGFGVFIDGLTMIANLIGTVYKAARAAASSFWGFAVQAGVVMLWYGIKGAILGTDFGGVMLDVVSGLFEKISGKASITFAFQAFTSFVAFNVSADQREIDQCSNMSLTQYSVQGC